MQFFRSYLFLFFILTIGCSSKTDVINLKNPMFVTEPVMDAGMDSIGFLMRKHVIVVTVKDKNELHVYNAMNGKLKKSLLLLLYLFHWRTLIWYVQWPFYEIRYWIKHHSRNKDEDSLQDEPKE